MITSLIDSVSQWSLGYSLFCHTGFWGPQYSNSFTDIQTLSLSLLFWFSSVHSKKTFNATHQIMLLSMRWDTKYVVTLPAISKTEMHSSAPVPTHPCAHAHTHTHTHTHAHTTCSSPAIAVGTSGSVLFAWLWNLPSHSVECFCTWKQWPFSQFLGLR